VEGEKYQADKIAVLYTAGQIFDKSSGMGSGEEIVYTPVIEELEKLRKDDHVKAVVLRVNSPGGSAYASEQICQAIKELKKVKPVIASMGDYAASGGYYISSNADSIIASPTTITGSIGIFGMFYNAEKLAQKVGLHYDMVKTNRFSDFGNMLRAMTPGEKALMQANIERGYELFVNRCAVGRNMKAEDIKKVAEGRVWTGEQALSLGLVDKLGYVNDAIEMAANMAGLSEYSVVSYPEKKDAVTALMEELTGSAQTLMQGNSAQAHFENILKDLERNSGSLALMPYTFSQY
jgi:protease-4